MTVVLIVVAAIVVLYLLMIMPRVLHRPDMTPFRGRFYAHRGLHDNASGAPENSMPAFKKAVEAGYGIELDIQLTKDQQVVVFHDDLLQRVCGVEGKVSDYTYEQLQEFCLCKSEEKIPLFSEVLELVDGKVPLIVELKENDSTDTSLCLMGAELLDNYKGLYCVESFNPVMVAWFRKNRPRVVRGQLSERFFSNTGKTVLYFVLQNLLLNFYTKPDFIAYQWSDRKNLSRRICRGLYGTVSVAWTIQSQETMDISHPFFDIFIFDSFIPDENKTT